MLQVSGTYSDITVNKVLERLETNTVIIWSPENSVKNRNTNDSN